MTAWNQKNKICAFDLLNSINPQSVSACFFDPQYRGVLDKLNYGNEGIRQVERNKLPQMSGLEIKNLIRLIESGLRPSGHLFLWIDKHHLCEGDYKDWLGEMINVDMLVWEKNRIGMGYRTRRKSEFLIICQKKPKRAKGCWVKHNIPDVWKENKFNQHAHSKPYGLQKALIEAVTVEGDLVLDPCSGGYSVLEACKETGRNFIGGDLNDWEETLL